MVLLEPRYSDFFDPPHGVKSGKSARRPGATAPSKVRFHDEVKVKTIKPRGKGLPLSIMRLLDDEPDDDDDASFETESEDDSDDDQWDITQRHPVNKNSGAVSSSADEGGELDGDEGPEGKFTFNGGHHTIKRLQDDLLADEDEPDDGVFLNMSRARYTYIWLQGCLHMRSVFPPFNGKSRSWRLKMLPRRTGL